MRANVVGAVIGLFATALVAGCDQEPPPVREQIRPIRSLVVTEVASGQSRRFSGIIEAVDSSGISFEVGGTVQQVLVNQGDTVRRGQTLAVLDPEPYRLQQQAAEAELQRARAVLAQARADYERNSRLIQQRAVAQAAFEVSQREFQAATSQVDYATARVNLVQRDVRNTTLVAPFDGTISERLVDPFVQVQAGQRVFRIDAKGGMQAAIGVPETSIAQVKLGMPAVVTLPQLATPISARISEVGSAAGAGNVFPVKAALISPPPTVRAGMTAEVALVLGGDDAEASYFVPLSAIAPGETAEEGFVFVFDPVTSTVRRTAVRAAGPLMSNMVAVRGISAGDIIATAGVNFLVDGQTVKLMQTSPTSSAG